jgi:hypothetical protein
MLDDGVKEQGADETVRVSDISQILLEAIGNRSDAAVESVASHVTPQGGGIFTP